MTNFNVRILCVLVVLNLFINVTSEARSISLTKPAGKSRPGHLKGIAATRLPLVTSSFGKDQKSTPVNGDYAFAPVTGTCFLPVHIIHLSLGKMLNKIIQANRIQDPLQYSCFLLVRKTDTQTKF